MFQNILVVGILPKWLENGDKNVCNSVGGKGNTPAFVKHKYAVQFCPFKLILNYLLINYSAQVISKSSKDKIQRTHSFEKAGMNCSVECERAVSAAMHKYLSHSSILQVNNTVIF